ncbi:MAG TPA: DNA-formamidopyrimidine glycosylase family protein [Actinomycetota bacterium]|nr:DNA-formamidopyrimidine glycosylase family protein [Actinomycetota bacterium]
MPELPDVEAYRRFFRRHAVGRKIETVSADPTIIRNTTPRVLRRALQGRTFEDPDRLGKWLICPTDGPTLLLHFGMTGDLIWSGEEPERHRHDRLILGFEGGDELRYRNMRKLGGVWLAHDQEEAGAVLGPLGPDALAIGRREFLDLLGRRRGGVKAALMDQSFVAGVGNIIADEVLWHARIHPRRRIESLGEDERRRLFHELHKILREAVMGYDYIPRKRSWLSGVRGLPDARCPRCASPLRRATVAGRTTYFCPTCQRPDPVPWAT